MTTRSSLVHASEAWSCAGGWATALSASIHGYRPGWAYTDPSAYFNDWRVYSRAFGLWYTVRPRSPIVAKRKVNKKVVRKPRKAPPQAPQDQDHPDAVPLPRFPRLRLSSLPGPLSFRLAGGLLKDEE